MKKVYDVSVKLLSALHINGGVDSSGVRIMVKSDKKAYIPATLFKGIVRDNFEKMISLLEMNENCNGKENAEKPCGCMSCKMFGKAGFQRSRIIFDNLTTEQKLNYSIRTNISVNRYLHKVNSGNFVRTQITEPLDKEGNAVVFRGQITAHYPEDYADKAQACLITAVEMIKCLGSGKSRGLGFVEVAINEAEG